MICRSAQKIFDRALPALLVAGLLSATAPARAQTIGSSNADAAIAGFAGQDYFVIDSATDRLAFYAAYTATSLTGGNDYSMSASVGGDLALHNHQDSCIDLDAATFAAGSLGTTTARTAFFYLVYNGPIAVSGNVSDTNPITLSLFNGLDCAGAAIATLSRNAAIDEASSATNPATITRVPIFLPLPGDPFRLYEDGNAGTIHDSFGLFLFTASTSNGPDDLLPGNWRPDILKLTHSQLCIPDGGLNGQPNSGDFSSGDCTTGIVAEDTTFASGLGAQDGQDYHVVYEFIVLKDPDANDVIPLTPTNYIQAAASVLTVAGLAVSVSSAIEIPTLGPWMLALLAVVLAATASRLMRRTL